MNKKSNQLAYVLKEKGVEPDTIVGVMVERSLRMITAIFAILKAGGTYLPIDPGYPRERIDYILADSSSKFLLDEPEARVKVKAPETSPMTLTYPVSPANLAYIIYTSGSTGKPKGVGIQHASVVNIIFSLFKDYPFCQRDTYLFKTPCVFDVSVSEIFGWFLGGGRLAVLEAGGEKDPQLITKAIADMMVTHINFVPSMFNVFVDSLHLQTIDTISSLKYIFLAGEALPPLVVNKFRELNNSTRLENIYGPTEATVYAAKYPLAEWKEGNNIPIGKPLQNTKLYVLGKYNNLQPIGVSGELCIAGIGVASGYLNRPELTAEKFCLRQPGGSFTPLLQSPLYLTGDLARWLPEGDIEFLGRMDHQVKIRGYRIEPGEIENRIRKHQQVKAAVVLARGNRDETGDKYLCAYVVPANKGTAEKVPSIARELKNYLSQSLPDYMIPSYFMELEQIPLTPSGKIHRSALPAPVVTIEDQYTAPRDQIEKTLVEIWSSILNIEPNLISIDGNFFQLGGHSLKATIMISRIHKTLDVRLPLAEIFKTPNIRQLAQYIKNSLREKYVDIKPVEKKQYYIVSSAQKRLYILQQMELTSTVYNMPRIIPLSEKPNIKKLEETFIQLIHRHESFRTSFHIIEHQPMQRIHQLHEIKFAIEYSDLTNTDNITELHHSFIYAFDLSQAPLLRVGLVKTGKTQYLLLIDMHHILCDGVSHMTLEQDFTALSSDEVLPPMRIQYRDFSQWQNSEREKENLKLQEKYWLKEFEEEIPVLNLPTDYPRPPAQSFEGNIIGFDLSRDESRGLKTIALEEGSTPFMVLLATFNILLSKLSSQEDIVIGSPIAGRRHADLEKIIGMFVNSLALRNYPSGEKSFREFLKEVKQLTLNAFENQEYQFEDLVKRVSVHRDASRNPIFDVMLLLDNLDITTNNVPVPQQPIIQEATRGTPSTSETPQNDFERRTAKFDLTLAAAQDDEKVVCLFQYCSKLFKKETIERFISYFKKIISAIVKKPDIKLWQIEIISGKEKRQLLVDFNDTYSQTPKNKTIHQLFEEQVEQTPHHTALIGKNPQSAIRNPKHNGYVSITYKELNKKSDQLAYVLKEKGVRAGTIAGIMLDRSILMIIGIFGILKAGGTYLPIEPGYPRERIDYILADSSAKFLLDEPEARVKVNAPTPSPMTSTYPVSPANLAYIIYTSGSTGKPKGVGIPHASVVNIIFSLFKEYPFCHQDTYLFKTPYMFDVSVSEIFGWFLGGGRLAVLEAGGEKDPQLITKAIADMMVTHINFVPSMFNVFVDSLHLQIQTIDTLSSLKYIFLAGEALPPSVVNKFRELNNSTRLENIYGPTEATVYAAKYPLSEWKEGNNIPIGKPLQNTKLYVLGKYNNLHPIGVSGELCIGGIGIASGYLNRPELTAEKFCLRRPGRLFLKKPPPWTPHKNFSLYVSPDGASSHSPHSLIYRTGDLARWLPEGDIEFLGRMDHQVKIRGYRIEPGEIENRLLTHQQVKAAVVLARENRDETGDKYLCAYVVPANKGTAEKVPSIARELKNYLSQSLPDYMIPSYFMELEQIPLTTSGKIHRSALPAPVVTIEDQYTAPRDQIEKTLVEIWSSILSIEPNLISIDGNFFQLGGHSLKATIMISRIHKTLDVRLPLAEIFKTPNIRQLAGYLKNKRKNTFSVTDSNLVLLREVSEKGHHLYFIHDGSGEIEGYGEFCQQLDTDLDFNCWGIQADKIKGYAPQNTTIEEIAGKYIEKIKSLQPQGPFFIAGWSIGGTIAFEMVRQLEQMKEKIAFLALFDSPGPPKHPNKNIPPFNPDSENRFIKKYLMDKEIEENLENTVDINQTWSFIADYLESKHFDIEMIKKVIVEYEAHVVPHYNQLKIKELIKYLNVGRTFNQARALYTPPGKIHTPIHYFAATQSKKSFQKRWETSCTSVMKIYKITGNHFSIFKMPNVETFARTFAALLKNL